MELVACYRCLQDRELSRIKACTGERNIAVTKSGEDTIISVEGDLPELIGVLYILDQFKYKEIKLQR